MTRYTTRATLSYREFNAYGGPQRGASDADLRRLAGAAEDLGLHALSRSGPGAGSSTYRLPGRPPAFSLTRLDHVRESAVELGVGALWLDEDEGDGAAFPGLWERVERMDEVREVAVVAPLWGTRRLAARLADRFGVPFATLDRTAALCKAVRRASVSRDGVPGTVTYANTLLLCVGENHAGLARRADQLARELEVVAGDGSPGLPARLTPHA